MIRSVGSQAIFCNTILVRCNYKFRRINSNMFCTNCGETNRNEAQFCSKCGNNLHPGFTPPSVTEAPTAPLPPPSVTNNAPYTPPIGSSYPSMNTPNNTPPSYANYTPPLPNSASGRAIGSLVLAIVSVFTCGPLFAIPAIILAKLEMDAIKSGSASAAGMGIAKAGFWIGIVCTVLYCGGIIFGGLFGMLGGILGVLTG
jgi:zinc-ribbon domain